ncbi:MAG: DUF58 domain-containing protein [Chloroflexota bacterium]|nr:DUF58 domain-containing protein [Chloroflexota bacterium]
MNTAQRIVIVLLVVSVLAGMVTESQLYYRLSYLWALLLVGSWLMSRNSLRGVQVNRTARSTRSQVGEIYEERYEVRNLGRLPRLWLEVRDESPLPGSSGSHVVTMIGGGESRTYLARTPLVERGIFPLGPTVLASGDLFGLFPADQSFAPQDKLLVYPMMFDILNFPNPPGLLPGGEALRRRTTQITSNASGVREYEAGDPLNRIHWLSTARRDRLISKEFELDPLAEVWIIVDADKSVQAAQPWEREEISSRDIYRRRKKFDLPPSTIEYSVSIAASLARYYLQRGRAVGIVYENSSLTILPTDRGGRQLNKILEALAVLRADGSMPLQSLVELQAQHMPRGSTVVLITSSASAELYRTADLLLRRGLRPVAALVDAISFGGTANQDEVALSMEFLGVPVRRIRCKDDLSETLSQESESVVLNW